MKIPPSVKGLCNEFKESMQRDQKDSFNKENKYKMALIFYLNYISRAYCYIQF